MSSNHYKKVTSHEGTQTYTNEEEEADKRVTIGAVVGWVDEPIPLVGVGGGGFYSPHVPPNLETYAAHVAASDVYAEDIVVDGIVMTDDVTKLRQEKKLKLRRALLVFVCLFIVLMVIFLMLSFGESEEKAESDQDSVPEPTSPPTTSRFYEVTKTVEQLGTDLSDSNSAGYQAAFWMANEDPAGFRSPTDPRFFQRYGLAALYFATGGDSWRSCSRKKACLGSWEDSAWLSEHDECTWAGISCSPKEGGVVDKINIGMGQSMSRGLSGTLPDEISHLTALKSLLISNQDIRGTIPASLGNLTNMEMIILSSNKLVSPIPTEWLLGAKQMRTIFLSDNSFTGPIPKAFTEMTGLTDVELDCNQFTGTIHAEFGLLPNLRVFHVDHNKLEGTIPDEFYDASKLATIIANNNDFTGTISAGIGQLTDLVAVNVSNNRMDGPIPDELYHPGITQLKNLDLSNNRFTGTLSSEIGNLEELHGLFLQNNKFTGTVPDEIADAAALREVILNGNNFIGVVSPLICGVKGVGGRQSDIRVFTVDCDKVNCTKRC